MMKALRTFARTASARWHGLRRNRYLVDLSFSEASRRFHERNDLHRYMHHHFHNLCPKPLRLHRDYFRKGQRGFGEDAFHSLWWTLFRECRPQKCLEIGVYRGQTISLWAMIAKELGFQCEIHGISPFKAIGDSVSEYPQDVDYLRDVREAFDEFSLTHPTLVRALSSDAAALEHIARGTWNLIYIDGSHDYDVVLSDYEAARPRLAPEGLLVFDDASLGTSFDPPRFSFAGHAGPSRVAAERAMKDMDFIGAVGHINVFRQRAQSP